MKRSATDIEMDLSSPTAKKLCLDNPQSDVPGPTTPIDDLDDADDLYGDSSIIINQRDQSASEAAMHDAPRPQPPSLQYQHIQLPGLGLYQTALTGPGACSSSDLEAANSPKLPPVRLNGTLQTATPTATSSQPEEVKAAGTSEILENVPGEHGDNKEEVEAAGTSEILENISGEHSDNKKEVEAAGTSEILENIPGEQSDNKEERNISAPAPQEADSDPSTVEPTVSASEPCQMRSDGVATFENAIEDGLVRQDRKDEHMCAEDDGQSPTLDGVTKTGQSANEANTQKPTWAIAQTSRGQEPSTQDPATDRSVTTKETTTRPEQQPSNLPALMESKHEGADVHTIKGEQFKEMRNTVPDNFQQPLSMSEQQTGDGKEEVISEEDQIEQLKDSEAQVEPERELLGPSKSMKPESEGISTTSMDQEQPQDIADEALLQPLDSPKIMEQRNTGAEGKTSEPDPSEQSQISHAPVPEGAQISEETADINTNDQEAEFEIDSSPIQSSSDSDSDSSSSSSADSEYKMLDPEEEARRLMQEDGGSEDEGKGGKAASGPLRTLNEKPDEIVPKPQIEVTAAMAIAELGVVEHLVESSILIKAKVSGESQALEVGSLLCLQDRSVIGVIAETLGQVRQPYYAVRFTNAAAIAEAGLSKGIPVFYVEQHARYIFTQNLKALKGSDASNIHDEEVGDDELEFSDDEAEAEHKRRLKQARQSKRGGRADRGDGFARGPGGTRVRRGGKFNQADDRSFERLPERPPISYNEQDDGDDLYTPLARPTNLHETMGHHEAPQEHLSHRLNIVPNGQAPRRGRPDRGRGRGDRGRGGRGGRGDRRDGGGFDRDYRNGDYHSQQQQHQTIAPTTGQELSFPPNGNAYQYTPSYGWPHPYPSVQNNHPSYNAIQHQSIPFPQQPPYANQNSSQYPQPPVPQQYPYVNPFSYQQSSPQAPNGQFPQHQAASPTSPVPPSIPPGAHINPAFFSPTSQQPPAPQIWQQQHQQQNTYGSPPHTGRGRSPQSEGAFLAAQEKLNLLRQLSRGGGSPT
ncbi:MAG: hypothetical protein Q9216_006494 [Gyalolechia sp. 2 TL-2023]